MGKTRLIAETGAGQHGVATAMVGALFGLRDPHLHGRQGRGAPAPNVFRMRLMGAEVIPVDSGSQTLKDAINEALRDWAVSFDDTHYLLGTVAGPHPYPADGARVPAGHRPRGAGADAGRPRAACPTRWSPAWAAAPTPWASSATSSTTPRCELIGVEAAGAGPGHRRSTARRCRAGSPGILHGARSLVLQDDDGQIQETHSMSAGLDYPGVGPEHAHLQATGRAQLRRCTDDEALDAFAALSRAEGIMPALESAHALAHAIERAEQAKHRHGLCWSTCPAAATRTSRQVRAARSEIDPCSDRYAQTISNA